MTSVPLAARSSTAGNVRPLNILRDLPRVADLIELCFANSMDSEGQSYVQQMRRASLDSSFMRWANHAIENASMPLSGFVWEQDGRIVGNASLVPFRYKGKRIYLIANVATHPNYRRQGIAHALTKRTMQQARQRGAHELWLHVRKDNPGAIRMYSDLGFVERAYRTTWRINSDTRLSSNLSTASASAPGLPVPARVPTVTKRYSRYWPQQIAWLNRLHPEELGWYRDLNWNSLKPGVWNWLYRVFIEFDLHQWAVQKKGRLQGVVSWIPTLRSTPLWLACDMQADTDSIATLLARAHRDLGYRRNLTIEHPAGLQEDAFLSAGFTIVRTLIWMQARGAT